MTDDPFLRHRLRPRSAEVVSAAVLLWWGLVLLMPWRTFDSSRTFRAMQDLMPEQWWGLLALAIGVPQAVGIFLALTTGSHGLVTLRRTCLVLTTAWWGFIAAEIAQGNPHGTGVGVYAILCLATAWCYAVIGGRDAH